MSFTEAFRVALTGLVSNRMRSILTMLGIIIGVSAVIALLSFGQGFQNYVTQQFQSLGSNLVVILPVQPSGPNSKNIKAKQLTVGDVEAISKPQNVSGIGAVAPTYNVAAQISANGESLTMQTSGATPSWITVRNFKLADGRFIDESDSTSASTVVVIGQTVVEKLFAGVSEVVGQTVRINNIPFKVVGVLARKGGLGNNDQVAVIPLITAQTRLGDSSARTASGEYTVSVVFAQAANENVMKAVKSQIEDLLTRRHNVQYIGEEDFQVVSTDTILSTVNLITSLLTAFLGLIAGISLVVGGIGVMNIMLVSVTERTREIGLRKAVGARYTDLLTQFLLESILLCLGGGFIGILVGVIIAFVAGGLIPSLSLSVSPSAMLLSVGISSAIGIFFGLYPASRAAALRPIEALRYE